MKNEKYIANEKWEMRNENSVSCPIEKYVIHFIS